ncbi:MAG TPA: AsmA family protein [Oxalobacteraceae bacterium]|nr:AsmA family protein [Oxalobacteraceae bacterium]
MPSRKKILAGSAIGIAALLVIVPLLLSIIDWNFAKPWISQRVSEATGRSFAINGDLSLSWRKPAQTEVGWRRLVPWPHLRAHELVLGNPSWATTGPTMASVPQVDFTLSPLALFGKKISVSKLILTEPDLALEIGKNGQNNWTFKQREENAAPSPWQLVLHDLDLNEGTVRLVDPVRKADVTTRIDTREDGSIVWKISGTLDRDAVSGGGKAGALLSLQERGTKYPVEAELKVGKTEVSARGTLTNPRSVNALDVNLKISGASMSQLFPFSGLVLPDTPHFSTLGRVVGSLARDDFHLRYEKFTGKVGDSDIGGTLEYLRREPRALLRGEVVSNFLNLNDLAALVGTDSPEEKKKRGDKTRQPPDKVLPVAPFRTERWDKIDTDVQFTGKKIIRGEDIPIDDLSTRIRLDNGVLSLAPLNFGVANGKFVTELRIEGKREPASARMKITARGLKLNKLFPQVESMRASVGQIHANADLSATGNSLAALAASANGEFKAFVTQGTISKFILEAMGLNLGSVILTQLFGDRQVQLNCLASDFAVKDGLMQTRTFVVDTEDAIIGIDGKINLATEELGLTIRPESKGLRIISLRSPLYVRGSFKNPDVGVDKGTVALKAGAATVLGTVATPLAALLALINPGPDEDSPCASLLAQAQKKPVAPPPGKTNGGKQAAAR